MQLVNQYSAVFSLILPLGLLATAVLRRQNTRFSRIVGGIGLLLLIFLGFPLIQSETNAVPATEVEAMLAARDGRPLFLELYSNY
ncbi:MAG: hypothetical protein ACE5EY_04535 [Anaerolineae bacterium]